MKDFIKRRLIFLLIVVFFAAIILFDFITGNFSHGRHYRYGHRIYVRRYYR